VFMSLAAKIVVSQILIAAIALGGFVPAVGSCATSHEKCREEKCDCGCCCSTDDSAHASCCVADTGTVRTCRCDVSPAAPAVPERRQTTDEREQVRFVNAVPAIAAVADDGCARLGTTGTVRCWPRPVLSKQSLLCCWLA
jgi:hypothetical protein